MTGAQTDVVSVPVCEQAAKRVLDIATRIFTAINSTAGTLPMSRDEELMEHWYRLRKVAQKFSDTRDIVLSPAEREKFVGALKAAHELAHEFDPVRGVLAPPTSECTCTMAEHIKELTLMVLNTEGVPCA